MRSLTLIRGIPGSGKSTFARQLQSINPHPTIVLEADQYFIGIDGKYRYNATKITEAHSWCKEQTQRNLETGVSVIVANTFIRKWEMQPYLDMAFKFNIPVTIIIMNNEFKSIHDVPQSVIDRMKAQFEF